MVIQQANHQAIASLPFLEGTIKTVRPYVTDAGVWAALAFLGSDFLCQRPGQVGLVATSVASFIHRFVQFPGVAITLCFVFSVEITEKRSISLTAETRWNWFWKSYAVYLFRFFVKSQVGFLQYALEGAVGLSAAIKLLYILWEPKRN